MALPPERSALPGLAASVRGRHVTEITAAVLSLLGVIAVLAYVFSSPPGDDMRTLGLVMTLLIVFLPLVLLWAAVVTLRSVRDLRAEAERLQQTVDAMRASYVQTAAQVEAAAMKPSVEKKPTRSPPRRAWRRTPLPPSPRAAIPG